MKLLNVDYKSIQLYEETLKGSMESVYEYTIRIMVVGSTGSGKTTLLKRLLGEKVNNSERDSTSGIQFYVDCCDAFLSTYEWTRKSKVQISLTQTEPNDGPKLGENIVTGHYSADPSLRNNPSRTNQNATNCARITILDIAGNYAFSTFPSKHAVYLMVLDTSRTLRDNVRDVEIWMNTIHSLAPPAKENVNYSYSDVSTFDVILPPVILVGTHIDQIPKYQTSDVSKTEHDSHQSTSTVGQRICCQRHGQRHLQKLRYYLKDKPTAVHLVDEDFVIDNTIVDKKLEKLKKKIVQVASHGPYWGQKIPTHWCFLKQQLIKLKDAGAKVITRSTVEQLNKEGSIQIKDSEELDLFLKYLHETDTVIYFSIEVLRENIILDPQWLIYALKSIINAHSVLPPIHAITEKYLDFKEKGILSTEFVDAVWTKDKHPELHAYKDHLLRVMEQFNIIFTARSFSVIGEKFTDYFLVPCILRQEVPTEVISPELDPSAETTPEMRCIFTGKYLPIPIFHRLLAACVTRWPVAKNDKSEHLIFCECCVFNLDLFHRLTVYIKSHVVYAKVTRKAIHLPMPPDARLCSKVRRFITHNLTRITSYLGQNLQYKLEAPESPWRQDEGPDSDTDITHEHMNHARLCIALNTVCAKAMRDVLRTQVPAGYTDIYQAILAKKTILKQRMRRGPLNSDQYQLVFPQGQTTGTLEQFDITLLYTLIRNVSSVYPPSTGWGNDPPDHPRRDSSLGANVERIRLLSYYLGGHSPDLKINSQDFQDYWKKFEAVLHDIENAIGGQAAYSQELEKQKKHVVSIYEAS